MFFEIKFSRVDAVAIESFDLFTCQLIVKNGTKGDKSDLQLAFVGCNEQSREFEGFRSLEPPEYHVQKPSTFANFLYCLPLDSTSLTVHFFLCKLCSFLQDLDRQYKAHISVNPLYLEGFPVKSMPIHRYLRYQTTLIPKLSCLAAAKKRKAELEARNFQIIQTNPDED
jgi:hypothetical protein